MKILIVSEFFSLGPNLHFSGGVEARNFFVAKHLAKKHDVTVLTTKLKNSKPQEKLLGFNIVRVGNGQYKPNSSGLLSRTFFAKEAISAAKKINPDIVEGTNFITHFIALKIAKNNKIPAVAWYPDVWINNWVKNAGLVGAFGEILERYNLAHKFQAYIAISTQTAAKLEKIKNIKAVIIPCGVDISEFKQELKKIQPPQILTVSRLVKYKNVKDLVLAFALLKKSGSPAQLKIIGRGPEEKELKHLIKNLKLQRDILFRANISRKDLVKELKQSTIFCLPSSVEGFGIVVLEAAAAGIPSVLSDLKVFKEVTKQWQGSLVFPVKDVYKLKSQLGELMSDKNLYEKKRKEAIRLAKYYSWKDIAVKTEKVYKTVVAINP